MEVTIFEVEFSLCRIEAEDYLKIGEWGLEYKNMFSTKKSAIRICQSKFAKQPLNSYVTAVHAEVCKIIVSDKGMAGRKRVYNLFKQK